MTTPNPNDIVQCPVCYGTGSNPSPLMTTAEQATAHRCPLCGGYGNVTRDSVTNWWKSRIETRKRTGRWLQH